MLTCGFFNSVDGDRPYNAEQMNNPYKRIVSNGVFANPNGTPSNDFKVIADGTMVLEIKAGEGIFDGKWATQDAPSHLTLPVADVTYPRIDSVMFRVDYINRRGVIILKHGTPAANPQPPILQRDEMYKEYRFANIRVDANSTGVTQADVTDTRAGTDCGFVTHLLEQADITEIYDQWQAQFEDWFRDVKETLSTSTLIRSYSSQYITSQDGETEIPIQITQYNRNLDILQVFVNGLRLIPDVEYTVDSNSQITLTKDLDRGQPVAFVVYKSVDGSDAETVVQQVYELQVKFDATRITDPVGGVKYNMSAGQDMLERFMSFGMGFHTFYTPSGCLNTPKAGVFRGFGQMTNATNGWIFAMGVDGSVYSNYVYGGTWRGWRSIFEKSPDALWTGAQYMKDGITITPSKPLSECKTGWLLVWSDYDEATQTASKNDTVTTLIPKLNVQADAWNGNSMLCMLPISLSPEGVSNQVVKRLYIYDDHINGYAGNNATADEKDVVLRAVYEY